MLTPKETKTIEQLLSLVEEYEDAITLKEFEGFMFGLAMTPDVILPSEWLPFIFGEEGPEFESEQQVQEMMGCLMRVYNKGVNKFHTGQLVFPFQLDKMKSGEVAEIHDWVYGLSEALYLRDETWDFDRYDHLSEEEKDALYTCLTSIDAFGSEDLQETLIEEGVDEIINDLLDDHLSKKLSQREKIDILLMSHLPHAVTALIEHAYVIDEQIRESRNSSGGLRPVKREKVGRNQPCPCGSGKKYKKCCERKDDPTTRSNVIEVDFSRTKRGEKQSTAVFQLKIALQGARPPIWRRVQIPGHMRLAELHEVIQLCFGWGNYHLHEFVIDKVHYVPAGEFEDFQMTFNETKNEETVSLQNVITHEGKKFMYVYDFGDDWRHVISVEKILPPEQAQNAPVLLTGKRACPPEDCGGIYGFLNMVETLQDPDSPEYEELLEWFDGDFDPALFSKEEIEAINVLLREFV
jgi:yecA family protein